MELARLILSTERVFDCLSSLSQQERGPKSSGFRGTAYKLFERLQRAQDALMGDERVSHTGLLTIVGKPELVYPISAHMDQMPHETPRNGVPFLDHGREWLYGQLARLGRSGYKELDGALCFDTMGELVDSGRRIATPVDFGLNGTGEEVRKIKGSLGTKHEAAAFASNKGLAAVALSAEAGTVITFMGGKVVPNYTHRP